MKVDYCRTWCDYLTPCKVFNNIMVGEYECEQCKYFKGVHMYTYGGYVDCSYEQK